MKTEKYIVIKENTLDFKVGQTVELTEKKASALIGKIKLKSEYKQKKTKKKINLVKEDK